MKDTKKTTTPKKNNFKERTPEKEVKAPVVKEVKVVQKPVHPEEGDNKLVIVIALAVLVVVGTIIGLLVGCQKQETEEPEKPAEDIVVPVEDEDEDEETVKVVKTSTSTSTSKYQVTFMLDGKKVKTTNISKGKQTSKYTPAGYENCTFYTDKAHTKKFNFNKKITADTKIYMVCNLKEYDVTYYDENGTPLQGESEVVIGKSADNYKVNGSQAEDFIGWATTSGSKVVKYKAGQYVNLTSNLNLYMVRGKATVTYKVVEVTDDFDVEAVDVPDNSEAPVLDEIEVALNQTEVDNYEVPDSPEDAGIETPTYFIPVDEPTNTSKTVVSDDKEEVAQNEIKIGDIKNTPDWYTPEVDDNVEEKEMEFKGFTTNESGETEKAEGQYTIEPNEENVIEVNFAIPEEDAVDPNQEPPV